MSNAQYARFLAATGHTPPQRWDEAEHLGKLAEHPVVFVTWNDANAYAEWAGKVLPSGQQWEKAARGTRGAVYPWGDQPTPAKCNVRENGVGETTPGDRYQSGVVRTGFTTCAETGMVRDGDAPRSARIDGRRLDKPLLTVQPRRRSTMRQRPCAMTTQAFDALLQPKAWRVYSRVSVACRRRGDAGCREL